MKKKFIIYLILIIILSGITTCFAGCDSTSGRSNNVYLTSYRYNGEFILPIRVVKADMLPNPIRRFKSRMALSAIYDSLCKTDGLQAEYCENYIVVKDLSTKNLGYCIIYPRQENEFNYIASNMACRFHYDKSDSTILQILVPMHFIPSLIEDNVLIENEEYEFKSTKDELISFYSEYDFEVVETQTGIILKDTIGRKFGDLIVFDETVNSFEIVLRDSIITFKEI